MEFYPHNIPVTIIGSAVSASLTITGSLINNFAAISINTASLALNISGSPGTNGSNFTVTGPKGATGPRGDTGYRGDSVFLLSAAWSGSACGGTPAPETCLSYTLYNIGPGFDECNTNQGSATYYSTSSGAIIGSNIVGTADGVILYTNDTCTTVAANVTVHNLQGVIFYASTEGVVTTTGCLS